MKRKIVSLLLAGCLVAKGVSTVAMAAELDDSMNTVSEVVEQPAETTNEETNEVSESIVVTDSDTTNTTNIIDESSNADTNVVDNDSADNTAENTTTTDNSENINTIVENENLDSETDDENVVKEGDTYFEITTNEDGSQVKITYEYVIDEETGELKAVSIEELEGIFDEDGNLIVEESETENEDEDIGKIIGFELLSTVSFDHVPTIDELKAVLPTTATAIVKGEDENSYVSVDITFDESQFDSITTNNDNNSVDETVTYTLAATVSTNLEYADGVEAPELKIAVLDEGFDLVYQELTNEDTGITVAGMMPEGASLVIEFPEEITEYISNMINENHNSIDYEADVIDRLYLAANVNIYVQDIDGNIFTPMDGAPLLVTIKLSDSVVEKIAGNQFSVYIGEETTEHSFNAETNELSFMATELNNIVSVVGNETVYLYDISFKICSKENDEVLFESSGKYEKGTVIEVPEFYSSSYDVASIDWSDVQETATYDASYVKYVDSIAYDIETGTADEDLVVESYGDTLVAEDLLATDETTDTVVESDVAKNDAEEMNITENVVNETIVDNSNEQNTIEEVTDNTTSEQKNEDDNQVTADVFKEDAIIEDDSSDVAEDVE